MNLEDPMSDLISVTISAGTSLSPAVDLGGRTLVGIAMPSAWTAAPLTFQASSDGGTTLLNLFAGFAGHDGETTLNVGAAQFWQVDQSAWRGITTIKIRSGPSALPVNQVADRVLTLVARFAT
jgi:hypothetical protein